MSNTDSSSFMEFVPAISLRENERGMQIGAGWNPHYHQATDRYASYSDTDFRLGLNAAQTSLAAIAQLAEARLKYARAARTHFGGDRQLGLFTFGRARARPNAVGLAEAV
jgi:hypothetical protein